MIDERLRKRLKKDRPITTVTMRIPVDVIESLKEIARMRGFAAYQTLLKSYVSKGVSRDEAEFDRSAATSRSARPVATANRSTLPASARTR
jgi:hypothetical protein